MGHSGSGIKSLNIGTGVGYSVLDIVTAFEQISMVTIPVVFKPRRVGEAAFAVADPRRACDILSWKPQFTLRDMCRDAWRWRNGSSYVDCR